MRHFRALLAIVLVLTALAAVAIIYVALGHTSDNAAIAAAPAAKFQVVFIDVGQGDSALITLNGERILIDGGPTGSLVVSRLRALGVSNLDAVVATHPDADHVGGLAAVLRAFPVSRIYVNGDASSTETYAAFLAAASAEPGATISAVKRGDSVPLGGLPMAILNPGTLTQDTNEDSIVLQATCGAVSVLFTGDAEEKAEASMLAAGVVNDVDVLKAGHHGSNGSSSSAFLAATKPEVAVISAGRTNTYGHPAPGAMSRLAAEGALFEYTDTTPGNDSVTMSSDCLTYSFSKPPTDVVRGPSGSPAITPTATR